jgi:hypothetical protein
MDQALLIQLSSIIVMQMSYRFLSCTANIFSTPNFNVFIKAKPFFVV